MELDLSRERFSVPENFPWGLWKDKDSFFCCILISFAVYAVIGNSPSVGRECSDTVCSVRTVTVPGFVPQMHCNHITLISSEGASISCFIWGVLACMSPKDGHVCVSAAGVYVDWDTVWYFTCQLRLFLGADWDQLTKSVFGHWLVFWEKQIRSMICWNLPRFYSDERQLFSLPSSTLLGDAELFSVKNCLCETGVYLLTLVLKGTVVVFLSWKFNIRRPVFISLFLGFFLFGLLLSHCQEEWVSPKHKSWHPVNLSELPTNTQSAKFQIREILTHRWFGELKTRSSPTFPVHIRLVDLRN